MAGAQQSNLRVCLLERWLLASPTPKKGANSIIQKTREYARDGAPGTHTRIDPQTAVTLGQAEKLTGIGRGRIDRALLRGAIPHVRVGPRGVRLIDRAALQTWAAKLDRGTK